jgi:hypothetical protein
MRQGRIFRPYIVSSKKLKKSKKAVDKSGHTWYYNQAIGFGIHTLCGCSSMVESQPSKLVAWVRFPSPAPPAKLAAKGAGFADGSGLESTDMRL